MPMKLILVVGNDFNLRQSIALILQRAGYLVTTTDRACEALEHIQGGKYRLVILDFNMPETSLVLLPKIIGYYPHLSILILTDQPLSEVERENRLLSAHYLVKPISPERLLDSVGAILGRKHNSLSASFA
jgi:DNA-binding NtrC family response regulator